MEAPLYKVAFSILIHLHLKKLHFQENLFPKFMEFFRQLRLKNESEAEKQL